MPHFDFYSLLLRVPPLLFALTIHEFAHAWMAYRCGDMTAKLAGRLTLHPLAHLDPIGTLCMIFSYFGWAKPVPVNPANFRHPRRDDILVSVAGVGANLATAVAVALAMRLALQAGFSPAAASEPARILWGMGLLLVLLSTGLMLFNLIPLPPLDGSHVLSNLLPYEAARAFDRLAPMASILLLILVFTKAARYVLWPPLFWIVSHLLGPALI